MTALIEYLTVLLEYIDPAFGAHKQSGAQGKMPQLPPPSVALHACIPITDTDTYRNNSNKPRRVASLDFKMSPSNSITIAEFKVGCGMTKCSPGSLGAQSMLECVRMWAKGKFLKSGSGVLTKLRSSWWMASHPIEPLDQSLYTYLYWCT